MLKYLSKRIGRSILTLFVIVTLVFCLLRLMPVEGYFANYEKMTEAQIQAGLQSMGLLDPLPVQIGRFWWNALHGDLGVSHIYKVNASVTGILAKKLPISIQMGVFAMLLSLVIGIPMGLLMGRFKNRWPDKIGTAIIVLIQAVPAAVYYLYIQMYGTTALGVGLLFDASDWRYWVLPVCSMSITWYLIEELPQLSTKITMSIVRLITDCRIFVKNSESFREANDFSSKSDASDSNSSETESRCRQDATERGCTARVLRRSGR